MTSLFIRVVQYGLLCHSVGSFQRPGSFTSRRKVQGKDGREGVGGEAVDLKGRMRERG